MFLYIHVPDSKMINRIREYMFGAMTMSRISARLIGEIVGKSAREVNKLLEAIGYLKKGRAVTMSGSPTWDITDEGREHGEVSSNPHSTGYIWDPDVADELKKHMEK